MSTNDKDLSVKQHNQWRAQEKPTKDGRAERRWVQETAIGYYENGRRQKERLPGLHRED